MCTYTSKEHLQAGQPMSSKFSTAWQPYQTHTWYNDLICLFSLIL